AISPRVMPAPSRKIISRLSATSSQSGASALRYIGTTRSWVTRTRTRLPVSIGSHLGASCDRPYRLTGQRLAFQVAVAAARERHRVEPSHDAAREADLVLRELASGFGIIRADELGPAGQGLVAPGWVVTPRLVGVDIGPRADEVAAAHDILDAIEV